MSSTPVGSDSYSKGDAKKDVKKAGNKVEDFFKREDVKKGLMAVGAVVVVALGVKAVQKATESDEDKAKNSAEAAKNKVKNIFK